MPPNQPTATRSNTTFIYPVIRVGSSPELSGERKKEKKTSSKPVLPPCVMTRLTEKPLMQILTAVYSTIVSRKDLVVEKSTSEVPTDQSNRSKHTRAGRGFRARTLSLNITRGRHPARTASSRWHPHVHQRKFLFPEISEMNIHQHQQRNNSTGSGRFQGIEPRLSSHQHTLFILATRRDLLPLITTTIPRNEVRTAS